MRIFSFVLMLLACPAHGTKATTTSSSHVHVGHDKHIDGPGSNFVQAPSQADVRSRTATDKMSQEKPWIVGLAAGGSAIAIGGIAAAVLASHRDRTRPSTLPTAPTDSTGNADRFLTSGKSLIRAASTTSVFATTAKPPPRLIEENKETPRGIAADFMMDTDRSGIIGMLVVCCVALAVCFLVLGLSLFFWSRCRRQDRHCVPHATADVDEGSETASETYSDDRDYAIE
jgi:hypothetical protein